MTLMKKIMALSKYIFSKDSKLDTSNYTHTVWKCHDFSITQNLREINVWDSTSEKSVIWTYLEALNFDFFKLYTFGRLKSTKLTKLRAPKMQQMAGLEIHGSPQLISRKIWVTEKPCNSNIVLFQFFPNLTHFQKSNSFILGTKKTKNTKQLKNTKEKEEF